MKGINNEDLQDVYLNASWQKYIKTCLNVD